MEEASGHPRQLSLRVLRFCDVVMGFGSNAAQPALSPASRLSHQQRYDAALGEAWSKRRCLGGRWICWWPASAAVACRRCLRYALNQWRNCRGALLGWARSSMEPAFRCHSALRIGTPPPPPPHPPPPPPPPPPHPPPSPHGPMRADPLGFYLGLSVVPVLREAEAGKEDVRASW